MRTFILLISGLVAHNSVFGEAAEDQTNQVVERYLTAQQQQRENLKGSQMEVRIVGSIPKLTKTGSMQALRAISAVGKVTYDALRFEGDNTVKKEVIARFLSTEAQNTDNPNPKLAINPDNYKFKNKGVQPKNGRDVVVLEVNPKRKEVGLFKGEIWLDPATMLPIREAGRLVKSPSVFVKKMEFERNYEVRDGIAVPLGIKSNIDTRIVGRTEVTIDYSNFTKVPEPVATESEAVCPLPGE